MEDEDDRLQDERLAQLCDLVVRPKQSFEYEYDFGDGWEHEITLEAILPPDPTIPTVTCLAGKNACPPEDCGGIGGYINLLHILKDPTHEDHEYMLDWIGGSFDTTLFDLKAVNQVLDRVKLKPPAKRSKSKLASPGTSRRNFS